MMLVAPQYVTLLKIFYEKCCVFLIETCRYLLRRENNEFRVIPDIIISNDESDHKSCVEHCEMEIQKEEKCLSSKKKLTKTIKERLEICSIDLTQHLLISVRRGFCFYDFSKFFRKLWNKKRWSFQYRFPFIGECDEGDDEGGVSCEFYSGKTMSGQLCFKFFPLMHYFHKSNLENVYLVNFKVVNQIVLRSKN